MSDATWLPRKWWVEEWKENIAHWLDCERENFIVLRFLNVKLSYVQYPIQSLGIQEGEIIIIPLPSSFSSYIIICFIGTSSAKAG